MSNDKNGTSLVHQQQGALVAPGELAASAQAAHAQAQALARYAMAERHPRNMHDVRTRLLKECERPRFAEKAEFRIPYKSWDPELRQRTTVMVTGPSIRFAEAAMRIMGNIDAPMATIYDDDDKQVIAVSATDLETNATHAKSITIEKTIERKRLGKGQVALKQRTNSYGDTVFLVRATEKEVAQKVAAECSKALRTCLLRLVPDDIVEECKDRIMETLSKEDKSDPDSALRRVVDGFARIGVSAAELEKLLGHSLAGIIPKELEELRGYYSAIAEGHASWAQIVEVVKGETPGGDEPDPLAPTRKAVQEAIHKSKAKSRRRDSKPKRVIEAEADERQPGEDDE